MGFRKSVEEMEGELGKIEKREKRRKKRDEIVQLVSFIATSSNKSVSGRVPDGMISRPLKQGGKP